MPKGQKGINKMKKNIFKKIVASLATVAMAAGLFAAMPAEETKAANGNGDNGEYYVIGSMNSWDTTNPDKMDGTGPVYTYEYTVTEGTNVQFKIIEKAGANWENVGYQHNNNGGNFEKIAGQDGNVKITFDTSKLTAGENWWNAKDAVTITGTAFDVAPVILDVYTVKGTLPGCDENPKADTAKMTEKNGVFSIEFKDVAAGDYKFKVIQDGANYEWANGFASDELGKDGYGNNELKLEKKSNVVVSIDKATKKVTVKVTPVGGTSTSTGSDTGSKGNNTPAVKNEVKVEVTLDPSLKWDEVYVHAWGDNFSTKWPGVKMTAKDGKYYATIDTKLTKLSYVISAGDKKDQTIDIKDVNGQDVKITVTAKKDADGKKFVATAAGAKGAANTGDVAPVVAMLVVAMAAASVVIASKKKTICE